MTKPGEKDLPFVRILPMRTGALLLEMAGLEQTLALYEAFEDAPVEGILEIIPAARTLMIAFDPAVVDVPDLLIATRHRLGFTRSHDVAETVEIPVHYDGEDLGDVAALLGCSVEDVVRRHTEAEYTVAFTGFAPGFAYLSCEEAQLSVPRRPVPRTCVPAGSVGLAGGFSGVYPCASPGGWQLIGRTPLAMFDLGRDPASLLRPGIRVRFRDLAKEGVYPVRAAGVPSGCISRHQVDFESGIEVLACPMPVLLQDLGRPHMAAQGVSLSGALDKANFRLANRLVGNNPGLPALEIAPAGLSFRVLGAPVMAVTGAPVAMKVTARDGLVSHIPFNSAFALDDGDTVCLSPPEAGQRSYLAMRGGFAMSPVLGSASTDTLARIGPDALMAGDRIGILRASAGWVTQPCGLPPFSMPRAGETVVLDVHMGPRTDWFTPASIKRFLAQEWTVTPQSSRIGMRLAGEALERHIIEELPSEATLRGALQVPANGQPVLFLADHPLTGGYPVIANVVVHHLDLAGQIPAGARIRFNAVEPFAAIEHFQQKCEAILLQDNA